MIKILNVTKLTDYRWLNLYDVEYLTAEGKTGHWTFASRKPPQVSASLGTLPTDGRGFVPPPPLVADAVVIVPLLKDGRKRKLVTIKEFRIPLGDYEYGTPAGLYDHNETAEAVAKRELKEETGLKLTKVLYVGPACVSSAGLSDESVVYIVCECTGEVDTGGNEGTEDITVEVLDLEGVRSLRKSNNKISAKTLPFLLMFDGMNKIAWPKHMRQEQPKKGNIVQGSAVVYPAKGATFVKGDANERTTKGKDSDKMPEATGIEPDDLPAFRFLSPVCEPWSRSNG